MINGITSLKIINNKMLIKVKSGLSNRLIMLSSMDFYINNKINNSK